MELTEKIRLESKYLDENLYDHLLTKLKEQFEGKCMQEYGYLLSINKVVKIVDNYISAANSDNIFTVIFEVDNLNPQVGDILEGDVSMTFTQGIFLKVQDKLKVLVPAITLTDYEFNGDKMCYTKKGTKKHIKAGDSIQIKLTAIQYTKQNFNYLATLV